MKILQNGILPMIGFFLLRINLRDIFWSKICKKGILELMKIFIEDKLR